MDVRADESVVDEAVRIVAGDRADEYGTPERNFQKIAALWSAYLGLEGDLALAPSDVGMLMALLKIARQRSNPSNRDNYVDLIGYTYLSAKLEVES